MVITWTLLAIAASQVKSDQARPAGAAPATLQQIFDGMPENGDSAAGRHQVPIRTQRANRVLTAPAVQGDLVGRGGWRKKGRKGKGRRNRRGRKGKEEDMKEEDMEKEGK